MKLLWIFVTLLGYLNAGPVPHYESSTDLRIREIRAKLELLRRNVIEIEGTLQDVRDEAQRERPRYFSARDFDHSSDEAVLDSPGDDLINFDSSSSEYNPELEDFLENLSDDDRELVQSMPLRLHFLGEVLRDTDGLKRTSHHTVRGVQPPAAGGGAGEEEVSTGRHPPRRDDPAALQNFLSDFATTEKRELLSNVESKLKRLNDAIEDNEDAPYDNDQSRDFHMLLDDEASSQQQEADDNQQQETEEQKVETEGEKPATGMSEEERELLTEIKRKLIELKAEYTKQRSEENADPEAKESMHYHNNPAQHHTNTAETDGDEEERRENEENEEIVVSFGGADNADDDDDDSCDDCVVETADAIGGSDTVDGEVCEDCAEGSIVDADVDADDANDGDGEDVVQLEDEAEDASEVPDEEIDDDDFLEVINEQVQQKILEKQRQIEAERRALAAISDVVNEDHAVSTRFRGEKQTRSMINEIERRFLEDLRRAEDEGVDLEQVLLDLKNGEGEFSQMLAHDKQGDSPPKEDEVERDLESLYNYDRALSFSF